METKSDRYSWRFVSVFILSICIFFGSWAHPALADTEKLVRQLPDKTLGVFTYSGGREIAPAFNESILGKLWNDPSVQMFYQQLWGTVQNMMHQGMIPGDEEKAALEKVLGLIKQVHDCPFAIGLAETKPGENSVPCFAFLIVDAGEGKESLAAAVQEIEFLAEEGEIVITQVGPYQMHAPAECDDVNLYWGWIENTLVIALNDEIGHALKNIPGATNTNMVSILQNLGNHASDQNILSVYLDTEHIAQTVQTIMINEGEQEGLDKIKSILNSLGVSGISSITGRMGFSGPDMVSQFMIENDAVTLTGLPAQFKPVDMSLLDVVDARAMNVGLVNIDLAGIYDVVLAAMQKVVEEDEFADLNEGIANFESNLGFKIRDGLLDSLAGPMVSYSFPIGTVMEAPMGGFVIIAELRDSQNFDQSMKALGQLAANMSKGMVTASTQIVSEQTFNTFTIAPLAMMQIMPTWTIMDNKMILASNVNLCTATIGNLRGETNGFKSIRTVPEFQAATAAVPATTISMTYLNSPVAFKHAMTQFQQFWPMVNMLTAKEGFNLPPVLPNPVNVIDEMGPMVDYCWIEDGSFYNRGQGPILTESAGALAGMGVGVAVMMPAITKARDQAKKAVCAAQLKQIGLALNMYVLDHGELPPTLDTLTENAYLPDNDGYLSCPENNQGEQYIYRGSDLKSALMDAEMILVHDQFENHNGDRNVLFGDGHVEHCKRQRWHDVLMRDNQIRLEKGLDQKKHD